VSAEKTQTGRLNTRVIMKTNRMSEWKCGGHRLDDSPLHLRWSQWSQARSGSHCKWDRETKNKSVTKNQIIYILLEEKRSQF